MSEREIDNMDLAFEMLAANKLNITYHYPQTDIDEYGDFTESIWFSKHATDCGTFGSRECTCEQDPERSLYIMSMGLAGEVGEVMELLKKRTRDGVWDVENFVKEMGDVVYYWARLAKHFGIQPSEIIAANKRKLLDRKARGVMRGSGDNR